MKYSFKYNGLVKNMAVFTIITDDESGQGLMGINVCHHHYKVDEHMNIQKISYMDMHLGTCNTVEHRLNGVVIPSRADLVTESQTKAFLEALIERDIKVKPFGPISELSLELVKNYAFKIVFPSGSVNFKYYDGIDEESATQKARVNNKIATSIERYEGEMTGKLSL